MAKDVLVEVNDLHVNFPTIGEHIEAVRGVSFKIKKGETLGVVGESGSGKSVKAMSMLRLNDMAGAYVPKGEIRLNSERLGKTERATSTDEILNAIRPLTCTPPQISCKEVGPGHLVAVENA